MKAAAVSPNQPAVDAMAKALLEAEVSINLALAKAAELLAAVRTFEGAVVITQRPYPGHAYDKPPIPVVPPDTGFSPVVLASARYRITQAMRNLGEAGIELSYAHEDIRRAACEHGVLENEGSGGK